MTNENQEFVFNKNVENKKAVKWLFKQLQNQETKLIEHARAYYNENKDYIKTKEQGYKNAGKLISPGDMIIEGDYPFTSYKDLLKNIGIDTAMIYDHKELEHFIARLYADLQVLKVNYLIDPDTLDLDNDVAVATLELILAINVLEETVFLTAYYCIEPSTPYVLIPKTIGEPTIIEI